jgi:hypothetical protein
MTYIENSNLTIEDLKDIDKILTNSKDDPYINVIDLNKLPEIIDDQ